MTAFTDLHHQMDLLNGYEETGGPSGHDGNITKIWAELQPSLQGQPWCAACDCYLWKHAGHPYVQIDHPWGFSYCPDAVIWAKKNGFWDESGHYEAGDTIFFDWSGTGVAEHTGTVISDDGTNIHTFEGNTSPSIGGSQANGGGAYYRIRPHGNTVLGVLKSSRWFDTHPQHVGVATHKATAPPVKHNPFTFDPHQLPLQKGGRGEMVKWAQWALAIPVDGVFGPQTQQATRVFQRQHGLTVDGVIGPQTSAVLRLRTH